MRKVKINVTRRDLDSKGDVNKICTTCPVARALRRHKGMEDVSVGYSVVKKQNKYFTAVPSEVRNFIMWHGDTKDDRSQINPFSFTIEVPDDF